MAKSKQAKPKSKRATAKPTHDEMAAALRKHHRKMSSAVTTVLERSAPPGAKLHSLRFTVASRSMAAGSPCQPACGANEDCVFDSNSGWVCVPR